MACHAHIQNFTINRPLMKMCASVSNELSLILVTYVLGYEWGNICKKTFASLSNNAVENKIEKKKKGNCKVLVVNAQMQKNQNIS